ncbi:hypothetical protein JOM56_000670 [Amanita muscaria]
MTKRLSLALSALQRNLSYCNCQSNPGYGDKSKKWNVLYQACNVLFNPKAAGGNGAPLSLSSPWMHRSRHVVIPYITRCLSWPTRPPKSASSASRSQVLSQRFSPDDICNAIIHAPPLLYRSCIYALALLSSKGLLVLKNEFNHLLHLLAATMASLEYWVGRCQVDTMKRRCIPQSPDATPFRIQPTSHLLETRRITGRSI